MQYINHYKSPIGGITLGSDGENIIGLWFDGEKYFGDTLYEQTEEKEPPKEKSEIEQYQEQLQTAIDEQNFELAAELRDKIKALSEKLE